MPTEFRTLKTFRLGRIGKGLPILLMAHLIWHASAGATLLSGRYSMLFRKSQFPASDGRRVEFEPLTHFFDLNLYKIGDRNLSFFASLRHVDDLSSDFDSDRVLYAYVDAGDPQRGLSLNLGRQLITHGLDFVRADAAKLAYAGLGPFNVEGYLGLPVPPRESKSRSGDLAAGWRVSWRPRAGTFLALGYDRQERESDLSQERIGFDFSHELISWVHTYANTSYNIPLEQMSEALGGVLLRLTPAADVRLEYQRFEPEFDLDSIFNVFNVNPYDALRGRLTYRFRPTLSTFFQVERQFFERTLEKEDDNDTLSTGIEVANLGAPSPYQLDLLTFSLTYRDGFGGVQHGVDLGVNKAFLRQRLLLRTGVNVVRYKQITQDFNEDTSFGGRFGLSYLHDRKIEVRAEVENLINDFSRNEFRFLAELTIYFSGKL